MPGAANSFLLLIAMAPTPEAMASTLCFVLSLVPLEAGTRPPRPTSVAIFSGRLR